MLVLSRKKNESITIGDRIVVTVVEIRGDKVRLGIQAPTEIPVHRQEVYEAIVRQNYLTDGKSDAEIEVAIADIRKGKLVTIEIKKPEGTISESDTPPADAPQKE